MNYIRFNYSIDKINKIKKDIINTNEDFVSNMNTYSPNKLLESYLYSLSKYDYIKSSKNLCQRLFYILI